MEITTHLVWAMFFGVIGYGFFSYGKKQKSVVPFTTGLALFLFPYFVPSVNMLIFVGIALIFTPYLIARWAD